MEVFDPLRFPGWDRLAGTHPRHTLFHGTAWAKVLQETYGHRAAYFGRVADGRLRELLPVMEVDSPVTGRRGVSLPFTDFCHPLESGENPDGNLYETALSHGRQRGWRYLECRGDAKGWAGATPSLAFHGHIVNLRCESAALFESLDSAVRRAIRKAERLALKVEFGCDAEAMGTFFSLHCGTRRVHGLPPQPLRFFKNITNYLLATGKGFIAIARLDKKPVAAAVFFHQGREALFKFGASDQAFQSLRPNNLVMWEAMKDCATQGVERLHLGRTSLANEGLRRFKLGFGAREEKLQYFRYDFKTAAFVVGADRATNWANGFFRCLPLPLLRMAGRILYPHLS